MKRLFIDSVAIAMILLSVVLAMRSSFSQEYTYYSKGKRDPFIPLIISEARVSLGLRVVETIDDVKFEGIIFDPFGKSMAMLNGEVLKEGDKVYNVEVVKIRDDAITIKIYEKYHTIDLIKEGGEAVER